MAILTLIGSVLAAWAAPLDQGKLPPRPRNEESAQLPLADRARTTTGSDINLVAAPRIPWSRLAFQSYRDGNWEVYVSNDDGSGQVRLTSHSASDIHARLNRGANRIAFASNRTGNFEIFTMNADGTGLTQLTFNGTDDVLPSWSPDGAKIVFQSYRDGQAEVYVMNADGSGQTRLTYSASYDANASWSPDGSKIAFVSNRAGHYHIWVMNADGSGQQQLSNQPYSENPIWSPDGSRIAYDADSDLGGWQELWLMNADGSHQNPAYVPPDYQTDVWAHSWSPDGRYVAFTRIAWISYAGNWYWTTAYLDAWDATTHGIVRLSDTGIDWRPDWQTTDAVAPASSVSALPTFSRGDITVNWSASDAGSSGIRSYDVQYRAGVDGTWMNLWMGTTETSVRFINGYGGTTYYFRSRATDRAWNVEAWPSGDGDTHTTFYEWTIGGTVRDNTDTPVVSATVDLGPEQVPSSPSDADGNYQAYLGQAHGVTHVNWTKDGYGVLPDAQLQTLIDDATLNVILPPADNLVMNWGFESGTLSDWSAAGSILPTVTTTLRHTGEYAGLLGTDQLFSLPQRIADESVQGPKQLAFDDDGVLHLVWDGGVYPIQEVYYARRDANGDWSLPVNVSNTSNTYAPDPRMAVEPSGIVHVVWQDMRNSSYDDIYYARRDSNGVWSSPQSITPKAGYHPELAVDNGGSVHVVWYGRESQGGQTEIYYARRGSDSMWSAPQNLSNNPGESVSPLIRVEGDGTAHVIWLNASPSSPYTARDIFYARRDVDGVWSSSQNLSNAAEATDPQIALDASGSVHVVWQGYVGGSYPHNELLYTRRAPSGIWAAPSAIQDNIPIGTLNPRLFVDNGGVLHVVWNDSAFHWGKSYYARRSLAGDWSGPEIVAGSGAERPQVVVGQDGVVHVVCWTGWTDGLIYARRLADGTWSSARNVDVYGTVGELVVNAAGEVHIVFSRSYYIGGGIHHFMSPSLAAQTGDSQIAQSLTVPVTVTTPVLSLVYESGGLSPATPFTIRVDNGITSTIEFSRTTDGFGWPHAWIDLSAWKGQTITVTLDIHETTGQPHAWAYLDEISLGSAHPDLWVTLSGAETTLPGEQITYTISYGNRGGALGADARITYTLPAELNFVSASVPPLSVIPDLVWALGDLPVKSGTHAIVVTSTVASDSVSFSTFVNQVKIATIMSELETVNNSTRHMTFIGRRVYLPTIAKW